MSRKLRLVLDTTVYTSFLLRGKGSKKLFAYWFQGKFEVYTSKYQLNEIAETVHKYFQGKDNRKDISEASLQALLQLLSLQAVVVPTRMMSRATRDPKDDLIVSIALKHKADYLVSDNTTHINQSVIGGKSGVTVLRLGPALNVLEKHFTQTNKKR